MAVRNPRQPCRKVKKRHSTSGSGGEHKKKKEKADGDQEEQEKRRKKADGDQEEQDAFGGGMEIEIDILQRGPVNL